MSNKYKRTSTEELTAMADELRAIGSFTEGQEFVFPDSNAKEPTITYWIYTTEWVEKTAEEAAALTGYTQEDVTELPTTGEANVLYVLYTYQIGFTEAYQSAIDEFYQKVYHGTLTQEDVDGIIFDQGTQIFDDGKLSALSYPNVTKIIVTPNFLRSGMSGMRIKAIQEIVVDNPNNEDIYIGNGRLGWLPNLQIIKCSPVHIGLASFADCVNLILENDSLSLENCTVISDSAFNHCYSFNTVSLPSCTSIGQNAFGRLQTDPQLEAVYLPAVPPTLNNVDAFEFHYNSNSTIVYEVNPTLKFYVPSGSKSVYASTTNWSSFIDGTLDGIDHFEEIGGGNS